MTYKIELERHHILLVDDDALLAEVMSTMLEELGYRVTYANSGEEAGMALQSRQPIDLLLTDIELGDGSNGFELVRSVQANNQGIPVLYFSGASEHNDKEVPSGSVEILQKPVPPALLEETIMRALLTK